MTWIEWFCECLADDCLQQSSSKLEQQKLDFSPDADRIALIRWALALGHYRVRSEFVSATPVTAD
jgi:hypothetical protein